MQQQTPLSEELCTALMQLKKQDDKKIKKKSIDEDEGIILGGDVCNCRKSKCLKLYCQCFNAAKVCNFACHCIECCNTENHEKERRDAVKAILDRNPTAFDSKFLVNDVTSQRAVPTHKSGCRCRKSLCLKKYCECFEASVPCGTSCMCIQCRNTPDDATNANMGWTNSVSQQPTSAANVGKVRDDRTAVTGVAELAAAASVLLTTGSKVINNNITMSTATPTMMLTSDADSQRFALLLQAPSIMGISSSGGPPSGVAISHAPLHYSLDDDGKIFVANKKSDGRPPLPFPAAKGAGNNRRDGTKRLHPDFNFHLQAGGLVVAGDPDNNNDNTTDTGVEEHYMNPMQDNDNDNHMGDGQRDFPIGGVTSNALVMSNKGCDKRPSMLTRVVTNKGGHGASAVYNHSHYHHQTTPVSISGVGQQGTTVSATLPLPLPPANAHAFHHDDRDMTTATASDEENDAFAAAVDSSVDNTSSSSSSADLLHVGVGIDNRRCFDSGLPKKRARGAGSFLRFASPNTINVASALSLLSRAPLASVTAADQQNVVQQQGADS